MLNYCLMIKVQEQTSEMTVFFCQRHHISKEGWIKGSQKRKGRLQGDGLFMNHV
jgi:hypothetical protein